MFYDLTRVSIGLVFFGCISACALSEAPEIPQQQQKVTNLYDTKHVEEDGRFFNPWNPGIPTLARFFRAMLSDNPYSKQDETEPPQIRVTNAPLASKNTAQAMWLGHATVLLQDGKDYVITDPNFNNRTGFYPRKTEPALTAEQIPELLFGVISHNHYDHLDKGSILALPEETVWLVPLGLADWFIAQGRKNVVELDWWQTHQIGDWSATCVPAQHWSRRLWQGTNTTLWCGWMLTSPRHRYFFAGDTGYFEGFKEIAKRFPNIDLAMLPIGSFAPREFLAYQHMDPADALKSLDDLKAKRMLPIHWGAFRMTQEPVSEPGKLLKRLIADSPHLRERVEIIPIGGSLILE